MIALFLAATFALTPMQVDELVANVEKAFHYYVFPDVASQAVSMLKENTHRYETISNPEALKQTLDVDLFAVTHDKHVRLVYPIDESGPGGSSTGAVAARHADELNANFRFRSLRRLPGNVGYMDLDGFSGDAGVGQTIASAMGFLANTDALIIDLRRNGGGDPIAAQTLEAYFFGGQQQITSIFWRDPETGKVREDQQFTAATVPGPLYLHKPVYLLTSVRTFSCAEQFAYDLHNLKRVTLVGETTGGGANPGGIHRVAPQFGVFIPEGRAYSAVTKGNWEGTGIVPDVATSAEQALGSAYEWP